MAATFELIAEIREDKGRGASRRLRRNADKFPGIIYGGEQEPQMIEIEHRHIVKALENEAFYSHIITLKVSGNDEQVILKDLQRHPAKPRVLHADFQRVKKGHKISVHVPLHFLNEDTCPGVKLQGGVVAHLMSDIEVLCLPEDLPEFIEVDCTELNIGDTIHLSEIKVPDTVEIIALSHDDDQDQPVVNIHKPRAVVEEEEVTGEEPAAGESEEKKEGGKEE